MEDKEEKIEAEIPDEFVPAPTFERSLPQLSVVVLIMLLMLGVIVCLVYVGIKITTDGGRCVVDPIAYFNKQGDAHCECWREKDILNASTLEFQQKQP